MKLIDDDIIGILMRVGFGFDKIFSEKGFTLVPYREDPWSLKKMGYLQSLNLDYADRDIYDFKTTIGGETLSLLRMHAQELRNKANGSMPFGSSSDSGYGIQRLFEEADEFDKYAKQIDKKYSSGQKLQPEDKEKLMGYWDVPFSLVYKMSLSEQQLKNLKEFLKEYSDSYSNRDLEGQEEIPLAEVLANNLLSQYNKPEFVARYGAKRVAQAGWGVGMFCHSLMYLNDHNLLELLDLEEFPVSGEPKGRTYWKATFNNLSIEGVLKTSGSPSVEANKILAEYGKLKIIKSSQNKVFIRMDGYPDSKTIATSRPWYKVFKRLVEVKRLEKKEMEKIWNEAYKNSFMEPLKKVRGNEGKYAAKIRSQIIKALQTCCPKMSSKIKIVSGTGDERHSYILDILE